VRRNLLLRKDIIPRSYHVDIARHAADADPKWVDNLLSHFGIPGVDGGRQGSSRKISTDGILHIALIRELTREFGLPLPRAVPLAIQLLSNEHGFATAGNYIEIRFSRAAFMQRVAELIADGVESVTPARRGRPVGGP
jgi:hypothetical protein